MSALDAESMHRLAKMALDAGEVASPEEALEMFSRYRLRPSMVLTSFRTSFQSFFLSF